MRGSGASRELCLTLRMGIHFNPIERLYRRQGIQVFEQDVVDFAGHPGAKRHENPVGH